MSSFLYGIYFRTVQLEEDFQTLGISAGSYLLLFISYFLSKYFLQIAYWSVKKLLLLSFVSKTWKKSLILICEKKIICGHSLCRSHLTKDGRSTHPPLTIAELSSLNFSCSNFFYQYSFISASFVFVWSQ